MLYDYREDESLLLTIDLYLSRCRSLAQKYRKYGPRERHYLRCVLGAEIVREKVLLRMKYYQSKRQKILMNDCQSK